MIQYKININLLVHSLPIPLPSHTRTMHTCTYSYTHTHIYIACPQVPQFLACSWKDWGAWGRGYTYIHTFVRTHTHTYTCTHTLLSQISFDVAWSPNCIDGRCYQYAELALVTDYLVVMSYDERSQIYGPCVAGANSGYNTTATGILQYRTLGLNTTQLVLGVPWYGYNYPCLSLSEDHVCSIEKVPFRGADCSDAAGKCIDSWV